MSATQIQPADGLGLKIFFQALFACLVFDLFTSVVPLSLGHPYFRDKEIIPAPFLQ
jgi:hypothetical protein